MKKILPAFFCVIFLSAHASFTVASTDETVQATSQTEHCDTIAREDYERSPEGRAASFAKSRDENLKNPEIKQISIRYMKSSHKNADRYRNKKNYYIAAERYYDAAIYNPSSLLIFKSVDMKLHDIVSKKLIRHEAVKLALDDYNLGLEFYKYEPENDKSMSKNCLKKMQMKTDCLQKIYNTYSSSGDDFVIPKNDILQCMKLGADIFQFENYCK